MNKIKLCPMESPVEWFLYALGNEACRMMPELLKIRYDIELKERLIRADIGDKEINIFGRAKKNGEDVLIVGEVKLRLDEMTGERRKMIYLRN